VDWERAAVVRTAIDDRARADGAVPSLIHLCQACAGLVGANEVCISLTGGIAVYEPLYATGAGGEALAELQVTVGEGPGVEAVVKDRLVLASNLDDAGTQRRWPLFAPSAVELGVVTALAFPLMVGAIAVGVLEIYWKERLSIGGKVLDGLLFADAALLLVLSRQLPDATGTRDEVPGSGGSGSGAPGDEAQGTSGLAADGPGEGFVERWPQVHQATGMMAVQLEVGLAQAFARLRAYAYGNDQSLREVAREVVERRLRFEPDKDST
jgi:hypothetical protein